MHLFQLLSSLDPGIAPERCKIHLACWNGVEDPLDVYLAGDFDRWQMEQRNANFRRELVLSLIAFRGTDRWLFAGVHDSKGHERDLATGTYRYKLTRRPAVDELDGRVVVRFKRRGRSSYLLAERWADALEVAELRPEKLHVADFPGYSWTMLSKRELDIIVRQRVESWRAALGAVSGVYVIADRLTGKLYVGSATAGEGIWSRWCQYSASGHGGNAELRQLLRENGTAYAENFQFGVLEIADTHASPGDVLARETYWKNLLLSRQPLGYNAN